VSQARKRVSVLRRTGEELNYISVEALSAYAFRYEFVAISFGLWRSSVRISDGFANIRILFAAFKSLHKIF
jgi:hypothetical protein